MPHRDRGDSPRSFVCAKIRTPSRMKALDTERRSDPPPLPLLQVAPVSYAAPRSLGKSGRRSRILPIYARFSARKVPAEASKRRLTEKFLSFLILRWTKPLFAGSIIRKGTEGSKAPRRVVRRGFPYEGAKHYPYAWLFILPRSHAAQFALLCFHKAPYQP